MICSTLIADLSAGGPRATNASTPKLLTDFVLWKSLAGALRVTHAGSKQCSGRLPFLLKLDVAKAFRKVPIPCVNSIIVTVRARATVMKKFSSLTVGCIISLQAVPLRVPFYSYASHSGLFLSYSLKSTCDRQLAASYHKFKWTVF
eukprot:g48325.t1